MIHQPIDPLLYRQMRITELSALIWDGVESAINDTPWTVPTLDDALYLAPSA